MRRICEPFHWTGAFALTTIAIFFMGGFATLAVAQQQGQKTFSTPGDASNALFTATRNNDEKQMLDILGPDGKQLVSSGDEAEDAHSRANFVKDYQEMHRLVKEPDGTVTLYIGAQNWPTPIPIVSKGNTWYFDTDAGKNEILYRRIGRNEMSTIRVCEELVAAEKEYYASHSEYAQKIYSDQGQHDGLYWQAGNGEPQSPVGPLVAQAVEERNSKTQNQPTPYRGYFYHILIQQGKNASGGAKKYIASSKMTGGFAFVAYPAEYRSSGVMTFIVNQDGVVYEKDLGDKTEEAVKSMKEFNPNSGWQKTEDLQEDAAAEQKTE
jgi:Protein of unknown function (DUF2950)